MATLSEALTLALQHHQAGRLDQAEVLCRQILEIQPDHPDTLHLLGVVAQQTGRHDLAVDFARQATVLKPQEGRFHNTLGLAYLAQRQVPEAVAAFRQALVLLPTCAEAHSNLGISLQEQGQLEEAVAHYQQALALNPSFAEASYNLANARRALGQLEEAVAHYRQALALKPGYAEAHNNLGLILHDQGRLAEAVLHYHQALKFQPKFAEAYNNLALAFQAQGDLDQAVAHYQKALALNPAYAEAHSNLGTALREQGELERALAEFQHAVSIGPTLAGTYNNLGLALQDQGRLEEAITHFRKALALKPDLMEAENQLMHQLQHLCEWPGLDNMFSRLRQLIHTRPSANITPFSLLVIPSSSAEQLACARNWATHHLGPMARLREFLGFHFARTPKPRLRLGYLSADFRQHPIAWLTAELFELHDRASFGVYGFSYGPDDGSRIRQRIAHACDRFLDIRAASFLEAARRIFEEGVDILVDLTGYTGAARTQILALRPAPIQVNYLGYPGTLGADFIDYIITDRFITPPDQAPFFTEKMVYLPDCYQANDRHRQIADPPPTRAECGLPEAGFVFCCFNNTYKITPEVFTIWVRLLKAVPSSVLWLLEANRGAMANLRREAQGRGVDPERLIFAPRISQTDHLARLRLADLFLDTLPVNAHATGSDALWAGLPVLTCAGETFASRVAGSLLTAIGLPELITYTLQGYEALALRLVQDPEDLAALRARLRQNRLTAPLFDSARFTRHLEMAYRLMWERHLNGVPAGHIEVPALDPSVIRQ